MAGLAFHLHQTGVHWAFCENLGKRKNNSCEALQITQNTVLHQKFHKDAVAC